MKKEELFEAIGEIDDKLVLRKTSKKKRKLKGFATTMMVSAACLALVVGVIAVANKTGGFGKVPVTSEPGISEPGSSEPGNTTPGTQTPVINENGQYLIPSVNADGGCGSQEGVDLADYIDLNQAGIAPLSDENTNDGINIGPLMPMTFTSENGNVSADRDITYDFTDSPANGIATIVDEYVITNTSGEAQTLTYLYPYTGYRYDILANKPVVTVDGVTTAPVINNGIYYGNNIYDYMMPYNQFATTDDYHTLLEEDVAGTVPKADESVMNDTVTVYEYGYPYVAEHEYPATLFGVEKEYMNSVYTVNMSLLYEDEQYAYYGYLYESEENYKETGQFDHKAMLIFKDDVPVNITAYCGELTEENWDYVPVEEISIETNIYECTFKELALELVDTALNGTVYADDEAYKALFLDKLMIMISDSVAFRNSGADEESEYYILTYGDLDLLVNEATNPFGFYLLEDTVTVPAGGSITIRFEYDKTGKYWEEPEDMYRGIFGYDNCPNLGTNITFTSQSAAIADNGDIEIVEQNYGFDLENDIRNVELELDAERYYMYVKFID